MERKKREEFVKKVYVSDTEKRKASCKMDG